MRTSTNIYKDGKLWNGFDYKAQKWIFEGEEDIRTLEELKKSILNNK